MQRHWKAFQSRNTNTLSIWHFSFHWETRRLLRRTLRLQVTKDTQGGKMRVGVVYAAVQDGYLVFPLNVVQRCFRGYLVTDTS